MAEADDVDGAVAADADDVAAGPGTATTTDAPMAAADDVVEIKKLTVWQWQ